MREISLWCEQIYVRDLSVLLDSELTMQQDVGKVASLCYYYLRRLKKVRRILTTIITSRLVSAFVTSCLDYCNELLAGLPQSNIEQLQRVQNAAVRLVSNLRPRDKVIASLESFTGFRFDIGSSASYA